MAKFPSPPINDTGPSREDDPMMVRTDPDKMGIGARTSGLPKAIGGGVGSIEHVGGAFPGGRAPNTGGRS